MRFADNTGGRRGALVYALVILALAVGTAAGSVYLARGWGEMSEGISGYLSGFFEKAQEGLGGGFVAKTTLISGLITLGIIFIMGFFRFGFAVTGFIVARRGFITGFTVASFLKVYGVRGILIMLSTMPSSIVTAAVLLIFSAVSITFSMNENKFQKKIIFSYIFFAIFMVSIFSVTSLCEGFLTTTFMKLISPKIY